MVSKIRSAFLSPYVALTPTLANTKCGNVDYNWGTGALASVHDYVVTMMFYIVYLCCAVTGIVVIVSALQMYIKMNMGEEGVKKNIMVLVGTCLFFIGVIIVFPTFSGYQI